MTRPSERTKKKKFRRRSSKKSKEYYVRRKTSKHHCAICSAVMHGMPHGKTNAAVSKLSKTERRPSTGFGGVLCAACRKNICEDAAKVSSGAKNMEDVDFRRRKYVEIMAKKL